MTRQIFQFMSSTLLLQNIVVDERSLLSLPDLSRRKTTSLAVLCFLRKQSDGGIQLFLGTFEKALVFEGSIHRRGFLFHLEFKSFSHSE